MPSDLWTFSLKLYARPGIEQACLYLQDQGADICLLLCACWLGRRGTPFEETYLDTLEQLAGPWQESVVGPLRALRQEWRAEAQVDSALATLRKRVKELELDAERELLTRLEQAAQLWPRATADDLGEWLLNSAPALEKSGHDALDQLRAAAFAL
ncbi:TIGR02444 family protein [Pseudomonas boanensis]|uniref:TIGR02444 family protein n=1 Tax=Metapseudomonas boanensis TaxID=2822138 RepID=A0ABS5XDV2_9GAMM|nr:TIGR02444 family protein [Pseudomonas boanensis]MBT8765868.1 TIGR02444 family protein [Pseudomonas boanensis]